MILISMSALAFAIAFVLSAIAAIIGWLALSEMDTDAPNWRFIWSAACCWLMATALAGWITFALGAVLA